MKKLCFGSYMSVLTLCAAQGTTALKLCETVLSSVATSNFANLVDSQAVSRWMHCTRNVPDDVTQPAATADVRDVAEYFTASVIPMLNINKRSVIAVALKNIITSDNTIKDDTVVEMVNGFCKESIAKRDGLVLCDLLAGVFLYVITAVKNTDGKDTIGEITDDYIKSLETSGTSVSLISAYSKFGMEAAEEFAIDSHTLSLLTDVGGKCQKCGRPLGIRKDGGEVSYAAVVSLGDSEESVFCVDCKQELQNASDEDKLALIQEKQELSLLTDAMDAASRITLERQIEEILRAVNTMDVTEETMLKTDPVKVERKITERRLKEKALFHVTRLYDGVNNAMDRLSGENKLNVTRFAKSVKRMYEDASEKLTSQSEIYNLLVEMLFIKTGRKYREACEVIISYFVQRCEVFDEIAE